MAYRIEQKEKWIEVSLWGQAWFTEVLTVLGEIRELAPRKEISDLWIVAEDYVLPWDTYATIVKALGGFLSQNTVASKSAIVVGNRFQLVQAEMYREAARHLPYQTGVFLDRDEAIRWLTAN